MGGGGKVEGRRRVVERKREWGKKIEGEGECGRRRVRGEEDSGGRKIVGRKEK